MSKSIYKIAFIILVAWLSGCASTPTHSQPSYNSGMSLVGSWEVYHGQDRMVWAFTNSNKYVYERSGPQYRVEEFGNYMVKGNRLILQPEGKQQKIFAWSIARDDLVATDIVLRLVDEFGRKEMYYRQ